MGASGGQKGTNLYKIDARIDIEKKGRFRGRPTAKRGSDLVARRGVRGEGGSEERKERGREERRKGRKEGVKI